jgi:hypothetical protein
MEVLSSRGRVCACWAASLWYGKRKRASTALACTMLKVAAHHPRSCVRAPDSTATWQSLSEVDIGCFLPALLCSILSGPILEALHTRQNNSIIAKPNNDPRFDIASRAFEHASHSGKGMFEPYSAPALPQPLHETAAATSYCSSLQEPADTDFTLRRPALLPLIFTKIRHTHSTAHHV